ncbi:hypothetical protein, partial [Zoogloea oryzae]|uniref:hypothetical protein n=1 Tax=Zoogloea oryzae TaxID=310767 RepID=UPI0024E09B67
MNKNNTCSFSNNFFSKFFSDYMVSELQKIQILLQNFRKFRSFSKTSENSDPSPKIQKIQILLQKISENSDPSPKIQKIQILLQNSDYIAPKHV